MIQQRLLPSRPRSRPGFDFAGVSIPANTVGGDYFDFIPMRDGSLAIVVADVSGHGIGPALLMAETRAYLRALSLTHDGIGEILTLTNRILTQDTGEEFITLFLASVDCENRCLTYAGAGHEAYLLEPDGEVRRLCSTSLPLGVETDLVVPCASKLQLVAGQILLVITDGASELHSPHGDPFGIKSILDKVSANRTKSAPEIIDSLQAELQRFGAGQRREDDITMVLVKIETKV